LAKETSSERRRRITHRALPALGALALAALVIGAIVGSSAESGGEKAAHGFARAWADNDFARMHQQLSADSQRRYPLRSFRAAYENANATATATSLRIGRAGGESDGGVRVPVTVRTRIFGRITGDVRLPVAGDAVAWSPSLVFPGLSEGQRLSRRTRAPARAKILSVDGKTLAEGPAGGRISPAGGIGASIAGTMARSEDPVERKNLYARGFESETPVGSSGLERVLQARLEGLPGGVLLAGSRTLARSRPRPAAPIRSTIDTRLQEAAVTALGGRLGGVAALDPRSGAVRALAGIAFSAPQPPGSTFKIVTTTAALEAKLVKPSDKFPVQSKAVIDGVDLANANNELCGGTFAASFAHSCNSVFAPLGVKVGSKRLVAVAERYGWNTKDLLPGEKASTIPEAGAIVSPLEVGSTAIGQFKTLATPLEMASVAQTVANDGVRVRPTLDPGQRPRRNRVTSKRVADTLESLMLGVVAYGTGTAAAIPGVKVAGKTGTAELEDTKPTTAPDGTVQPPSSGPENTDAWFTSYAPAGRSPKVVVAVLLVRNGAGGATAAPVARAVLARALGK
jgi:cell division protein FtsI/penicillin-binding protein 2